MKIRVFGTVPPCIRCKAAEKVAIEAVKEYKLTDVEVVKVDIMSDGAAKFGVMLTPTVMVDNKVIKTGSVPTKDEIRKAVEDARKAR